MSTWKSVLKTKTKSIKTDIENKNFLFLSKYKVNRCIKEDCYNSSICFDWHNETDMRRNPYSNHYFPNEVLNNVERMYHPNNFRVSLCQRKLKGACRMDSNCAYAHSTAELRDKVTAEEKYDNFVSDMFMTQKLSLDLSNFVLTSNTNTSCLTHYQESKTKASSKANTRIAIDGQYVYAGDTFYDCTTEKENVLVVEHEIDYKQFISIQRSEKYFKRLQKKALLTLCNIDIKKTKLGHYVLCVKGPSDSQRVDAMVNMIGLLDPIPSDIVKEEKISCMNCNDKQFSSVMKKIKMSEENKYKNVIFDFDETTKTIFITEFPDEKSGSLTGQTKKVIDEVNFFFIEEKVECICCCDKVSASQGIQCENNHFTCIDNGCFENMIDSQISTLKSQDGRLVCAMCPTPNFIDMQQIASNCPSKIYEKLLKSIFDVKVAEKYNTLEKQFEEKLRREIENFKVDYENDGAKVRTQAKMEANKLRNEALNLSCPHCKTAYFDFTGCMALQCESCKKTFCGYCHAGHATSRGTHDHVRGCIMNESPQGSYYANSDQQRTGQRKFRIKKLKELLFSHKKQLRNAIVIEITNDLKDLGIDPASLFLLNHDELLLNEEN